MASAAAWCVGEPLGNLGDRPTPCHSHAEQILVSGCRTATDSLCREMCSGMSKDPFADPVLDPEEQEIEDALGRDDLPGANDPEMAARMRDAAREHVAWMHELRNSEMRYRGFEGTTEYDGEELSGRILGTDVTYRAVGVTPAELDRAFRAAVDEYLR